MASVPAPVSVFITEKVKNSMKQDTDLGLEMCTLKT